MPTSLVQILRKTLAEIEREDQSHRDTPAIAALRRELARVIAELEVARAARLASDEDGQSDPPPEE